MVESFAGKVPGGNKWKQLCCSQRSAWASRLLELSGVVERVWLPDSARAIVWTLVPYHCPFRQYGAVGVAGYRASLGQVQAGFRGARQAPRVFSFDTMSENNAAQKY